MANQLTVADSRKRLKTMVDKARPEVLAAMPGKKKEELAETFNRILLTSCYKNAFLMQCDPGSIVSSALDAAGLGLVLDGHLGHAYLVPFRDKKENIWKAQLIVGYRGMMSLARRSGLVSRIEARVVFSGDSFDYGYGLKPFINHKPTTPEQQGNLTFVYAIAFLTDGSTMFEVMSRSEVDRIRSKSKSFQRKGGPWTTDYDAMALKTVIRKLCKLLPQSTEDNSLSARMTAQISKEEEGEARMAEYNIVNDGASKGNIALDMLEIAGTPDDTPLARQAAEAANAGSLPHEGGEVEDPWESAADEAEAAEQRKEPDELESTRQVEAATATKPKLHFKTREKILRLFQEKEVDPMEVLGKWGVNSVDDLTKDDAVEVTQVLLNIELTEPEPEPEPEKKRERSKPAASMPKGNPDDPATDKQVHAVRDLCAKNKLSLSDAKAACVDLFGGKQKIGELTRAQCDDLIAWTKDGTLAKRISEAVEL